MHQQLQSASILPRFGRLAFLLGLETGATYILLRLGSMPSMQVPGVAGVHEWRLWLQTTPVEDALAATLRLMGLGCALWLLGSTGLYVLARAARVRAAMRAVGWLTIPPVRRMVDRALALSMATTLLTGPGAPAARPLPPSPGEPDRVVRVVDPDRGVILPPGASAASEGTAGAGGLPAAERGPGASVPSVPPLPPVASPPDAPAQSAAPGNGTGAVGFAREPPAADDPVPTPRRPQESGAPEGSVGTPRKAAGATAETVHEVATGDNLWRISRDHLAMATGRRAADIPDREVHAYWSRVIEANRHTLRSGDPNLIHPDESIRLPPIENGR